MDCYFFSWLLFKKSKSKKKISYGLIIFAISQEILDYLNRFFFDKEYTISWQTDLPLQFCHFGFYFALIGIIISAKNIKTNPKVEQFLFDCAYVLGFAGALQAMFNVDLTGVYNLIGTLTLNWQHSIIILNVLWLIFAYNKKFNATSILHTFVFMNIIILPIGALNYLLEANYMFICEPPKVESFFIIGGWPFYILWLELIYLIYVLILFLPFQIYKTVKKT